MSEELADLDRIDRVFSNAYFRFGLEAQGHIPVVELLLSEGKSWEEIGAAIGWHGPTAKQFYERYLARKEQEGR